MARRIVEQEPVRAKRRHAEPEPTPRRASRLHEQEPVRAKRRHVEEESPRARRREPEPTTSRKARPPKEPKPNRFADVRAIKEPFTRTTLTEHVMEKCNVDKSIAKDVLDCIINAMVGSVKPRGAGKFVIPGLFRIITVRKDAVRGGKTVNNPFKPGETMVTKSRPARTIIRIRPSKDFKDAVA